MTINDFKIGALVEHNEWGDGEVIANNSDEIAIEFINGIRLFFSCTDDLYYMSTLKIKQPISKMEITEEKTMQEFEPITADNIHDVLLNSGFKYIGDNEYASDNKIIPTVLISINFDINYFYCNKKSEQLTTYDFDEFIAFVQKRVELKPIPKNPEFDFEQYLLENDFYKIDGKLIKGVICFNLGINSCYPIYKHNMICNKCFAKTKENADILIAVVKLLEGLK